MGRLAPVVAATREIGFPFRRQSCIRSHTLCSTASLGPCAPMSWIRPDPCDVIGFVSQFFANPNSLESPLRRWWQAAPGRTIGAGYRGCPALKLRRRSSARQAQRSKDGCRSLADDRNEFNREAAAAAARRTCTAARLPGSLRLEAGRCEGVPPQAR